MIRPLVIIIDNSTKRNTLANALNEKADVITVNESTYGVTCIDYSKNKKVLNSIPKKKYKICFRHDSNRNIHIPEYINAELTIWYTSGDWHRIKCAQDGFEEKICKTISNVEEPLSIQEIESLLSYANQSFENRKAVKPSILNPSPSYYTTATLFLSLSYIVCNYKINKDVPEVVKTLIQEISMDKYLKDYRNHIMIDPESNKYNNSSADECRNSIINDNNIGQIAAKITSELHQSFEYQNKWEAYILELSSSKPPISPEEITQNISKIITYHKSK
jgi:hypothetical protein